MLSIQRVRPIVWFVCAVPLLLLALSGCPGPGDPVANCATCAECNPNTAFQNATVPLPQGQSHKLFDGGGAMFGCIGIQWDGQSEDPPAFVAKLNADGSYEVLNPTTREFTNDAVAATVAPGVGEIDVLFFIFRSDEAAARQLNCANIVKGGVASCWGSSDCLFAWKVEKTTASGSGGACKLCQREKCDSVDNDCDGKVDEDGACGKILGTVNCDSHPEATMSADTPGCSGTGACSCKVTTTQQIYVCAGANAGEAKWTPIGDITKLCTDQTVGNVVKHFCAGEELLCDTCNGEAVFRRAMGTCGGGVLKNQ